MRVDILPGSIGQPCIDEFEVFAPGAETNLALTGKATASSLLPGFAYKNQIAFLNEGVYSNGRSWIPAKLTGWAQIKLVERSKIDLVILSRDREGKLRKRLLASFDILVSNDGTTWKTVKKVRPRKARMTISEARELFLEDREESPTKESGQKTEEGSKNRLVGGKE